MRVHPLAPVVAVDIDGFLGDYHKHFEWFLDNVYFPYGRPGTGMTAWWQAEKGEFSEALGLDKGEYRAAKLAYRQGGLKRCMPQFELDVQKGGIEREIQYIRSQRVQVWVCTTRPWMRLDNIDPDTQYWLEHNVGQVDGVIYGEDKFADLIDIVGKERILGVGDDLPENIERAWDLDLRAVCRRGEHNIWWRKPMMGHNDTDKVSVNRLKDFTYIVDAWIADYNDEHGDWWQNA